MSEYDAGYAAGQDIQVAVVERQQGRIARLEEQMRVLLAQHATALATWRIEEERFRYALTGVRNAPTLNTACRIAAAALLPKLTPAKMHD